MLCEAIQWVDTEPFNVNKRVSLYNYYLLRPKEFARVPNASSVDFHLIFVGICWNIFIPNIIMDSIIFQQLGKCSVVSVYPWS